MDWDVYTVFAVLSGVILLIGGAVVPGLTGKDRAIAVLVGLGIGGYGIFVAA